MILELAPDEKVELVIARTGFVSQTLSVDTTEPSRVVRLAPVPGTKAPPTAKPKPTATPTTKPTSKAGGDFVDPWKH